MSPRRLFAAVLGSWRLRYAAAVLCLLAQGFAVVHLFAMHHVRCAEHGDLLHVEQAAPALGTEHRNGEADVLAASQQPFEAHQGDHCTTLSERRDLRCAAIAIVAVLPEQALDGGPHLAAAPAFGRALYRLAPKVSPPALV
jgi:hypothetical protein